MSDTQDPAVVVPAVPVAVPVEQAPAVDDEALDEVVDRADITPDGDDDDDDHSQGDARPPE